MAHSTDQSRIAELYARALLDLASTQRTAEAIGQELSEFIAYLKIEPDFQQFFQSQVIDPGARRESLERMLRGNMSDLLLDTLQVLNRRQRTDVVIEMQRIYHQLFMESGGVIEAQVVSAQTLSEQSRGLVQRLLEDYTGRKISLVEHVDGAILGGLIIRVGDHQVDASVARQLRRFHDTLLEHAARNIHAGTTRFFQSRSA